MKKKLSIPLKILSIICILVSIILFTNQSNAAIAAIVGVMGIGIIFVWAGQIFAVVIALALQGIMSLVTGTMSGDSTGVYGLDTIIFNRSGATTSGFFNGIGISDYTAPGLISEICNQVTRWYYVIMMIAVAALLFILLYIGIRMAISTVAEKEAKYKKMLMDWFVSLCLVFMLHFIMIITFYINNKLVDVLYQVYESNYAFEGKDWWSFASVLLPLVGFDEAIIFCSLIISEFLFFIMYIKRFITLAFLIVIAPLITITYAMDKLGDGRSQALNTWLKEFIFTVIIQPFHCVLYLVLVVPALESSSGYEGVVTALFYIIMINFMREAEKIIKKIFNIRADSMPDAGATAAITMGVMSSLLGKAADKAGRGADSGKDMPDMTEEKGDKTSEKPPKDSKEPKEGEKEKNAGKEKTQKSPDTSKTTKTVPQSTNEADGETKTNEQEESTFGSRIKDAIKGAPAKIKRDIKNAPGNFAREFKRTVGLKSGYYQGGIKGVAKTIARTGLRTGGAMFGAAAGMSLGGAKEAIGLAVAGSAATGKIESALSDVLDNNKLRDNEEVFAGDVLRFGESLEEDQDLAEEAIELWQNYQDGYIKKSSLTEPQRAFLDSCDDIKDVYDYIGAENSADNVKVAIMNAISGEIPPAQRKPAKKKKK